MGKFLLQRFVYLVVLVVIATASTYFLAAAALNPRSNFEGRNPPPPPEVVDARLDALNLNDKTPITQRFERWVRRGVSIGISATPSTAVPSMTKWAGAWASACDCC